MVASHENLNPKLSCETIWVPGLKQFPLTGIRDINNMFHSIKKKNTTTNEVLLNKSSADESWNYQHCLRTVLNTVGPIY